MSSPLAAHHRALKDGRYEVNIARPGKRAGSSIVYRTGRFSLGNFDAAVQWGKDNTPDGHRYIVTAYRAKDGWTPHHVPIS
jgi:hypothetical protein